METELYQRQVKIQDIAERAQVSISTVSRVLNGTVPVADAKREAVLAAVSELNYRPNRFAQSLASGHSMTIGVLTQNVSSPFYDAILRGILQGLNGSRYSPIFADGYWDPLREQQALSTLLGRRVDGIIVLGGSCPNNFLAEISQKAVLLVVGRKLPELEANCIPFDDFQGAYRATQHLLEMGHRHIAHVMGIATHNDAVERLNGYQRALLDAGISPDPDLIVAGDFSEQSGVAAVEKLIAAGKKFSAIFCSNDQMAYGVRLALFRRRIGVPKDLSIVGFDDQAPSAYMTPPLTTVRQPAVEIGEVAASSMLQLLNGQPIEPSAFRAELVVRESVSRVQPTDTQ